MQDLIMSVQQLFATQIYTASELIEVSQRNAILLNTDCEGLNKLLGGGVHSGQVIELGRKRIVLPLIL